MRRWDLVGGLVGLIAATGDVWLFAVWGLDLDALTGSAAGLLALASFVIGYAGLGFALGRLFMARGRALADAARIKAQLLALEGAQARLVQSEKLAAVGRLAAGIAHEVRNPLGVIRASASMVQESFTEESEDHRACAMIVDETFRLDALIGGLLAFARPAPMSLSPTRLARVLERAVALAEKARPLEVEAVADPQLELRGDPDLLTQGILDLLLNAAEAGAAHARVRATRDGACLAIDVADDGPGVPEADRARVFEPFFTTKPTGTGLGLPMVARIVEAHGGEISLARDEALGGARFTLRLPIGGPASALEAA